MLHIFLAGFIPTIFSEEGSSSSMTVGKLAMEWGKRRQTGWEGGFCERKHQHILKRKVLKNPSYHSHFERNWGWAMDLAFSLCDFTKTFHVSKLLSATGLSPCISSRHPRPPLCLSSLPSVCIGCQWWLWNAHLTVLRPHLRLNSSSTPTPRPPLPIEK